MLVQYLRSAYSTTTILSPADWFICFGKNGVSGDQSLSFSCRFLAQGEFLIRQPG